MKGLKTALQTRSPSHPWSLLFLGRPCEGAHGAITPDSLGQARGAAVQNSTAGAGQTPSRNVAMRCRKRGKETGEEAGEENTSEKLY